MSSKVCLVCIPQIVAGKLRQAAASGGARRRAEASGGKLRKCIFARVSLCVVALCACSVAPILMPDRASERTSERALHCVSCVMFNVYMCLFLVCGIGGSVWCCSQRLGPAGAREAAARLTCRFVTRRRTTSLDVRTAHSNREIGGCSYDWWWVRPPVPGDR